MLSVTAFALLFSACSLNLATAVRRGDSDAVPAVLLSGRPGTGSDVNNIKVGDSSLNIPVLPRDGRSVDANASQAQYVSRMQLVDPNKVLFGISKDFAVKLMWVLEELLLEDVITTECMSSLLAVYSGVLRDDVWALTFVDSTGKIPTGLLGGTTTSLGSYDECLSIRTPIDATDGSTVIGRYCMLRWNVTDPREFHSASHGAAKQYIPSIQLGICIPSQCTSDHLRAAAAKMLQAEYSSVGVSSCRTKEDRVMNKTHVAIICILSAWCTIIVLATLIHFYWTARQQPRNATEARERSHGESLLTEVILGLSAITSTASLFKPDQYNSPRRIIHGIRVLAVLWIFLGQTYELQTFQALSSPEVYYAWRNCPLYSLVVSWPLAFTALFVAGGVIGSGAILEKSSSGIGSFSLTAAVILRRYIALTIPALFMVGIFLLFPLMMDGPFANDTLSKLTSPCYQQWWSVLFHFNNWNGLEGICYRPLWYVACQFQLCVIICLPIIILVRRHNIGMITMAVLCAAFLSGVAVQASWYRYYPFPTLLPGYDIRNASRTLSSVFFLPFLHMPAIIVGAMAAYCASDGSKSSGKALNFFYWTAAITSLLTAVLSPYIWEHWLPPESAVIFLVGVRFLFACSLGWLVLTCLRNKSCLLSKVLSCPCFVPLSRLYMAAFLVSTMVTVSSTLSARELIYTSHAVLLGQFLQNSVTSYILAYVFYLFAGGPANALKDAVWKWWIASASRKMSQDELDNKKARFLSELLQPGQVLAEKPRPLHKIASLKDLVVCHL